MDIKQFVRVATLRNSIVFFEDLRHGITLDISSQLWHWKSRPGFQGKNCKSFNFLPYI